MIRWLLLLLGGALLGGIVHLATVHGAAAHGDAGCLFAALADSARSTPSLRCRLPARHRG